MLIIIQRELVIVNKYERSILKYCIIDICSAFRFMCIFNLLVSLGIIPIL